jgi:hypothetical protein
MMESPALGWSRSTLVYNERSDDYSDDAEIQGTALLVHQEGSEQKVMNKEDGKEDAELFPYHEYFSPFEAKDRDVDGTDIETEHWHCEEHAPQCQVCQVLMSFLFFHPFHIT